MLELVSRLQLKTQIELCHKAQELKSKQSLYTIEYKNKHIVQIQGYKNKEVIPEKVREVANKWVKKIS